MTKEELKEAKDLMEEIERTEREVESCKIALENGHIIVIGSRHTTAYNFALPEEVRECVMRTALAALENKLNKLKKEFEEL